MTPESPTSQPAIGLPVRVVILRLRKARSKAAEIAGSSFGTSLGSASTTVTSTPNDRHAEANSTPITPPPSTIAEAGRVSRRTA